MSFRDLIGKKIGNYRIIEYLGEGGQSIVYRAQDEILKRYVVIKFFLRTEMDGSVSEEDEKSFLLEARTLSDLNHPNIATIYTGGYYENIPYIVIEWIEGESLKELLKKKKRLKCEEAVNIVYYVAKALSYAHKKGLVHRDVKPSNIVISKDGSVKLLDFGLVKILGDTIREKVDMSSISESNNRVVGTISYMAPEMIDNGKVDGRSDLFSLGVVFYELITGKKPFHKDGYVSTMLSVVNDPPADYLEKVDCPEKIKNIIYILLEKDPKNRFRSADELIEALGVESITSPKNGTYFSFSKRKRKIFYIVGAISLLLLFFLIKNFVHVFHSSKGPKRVSVLVIPFRGGPSEKEKYLADLITSKIIDTLSNSSDIWVISTPVNEKLTKDYIINRILKGSRVTYIIDGTFLMIGDKIRVTAKIIDNRNSVIVWSDTVEEDKKDLFRIPAIVSSAISRITNIYISVEKLKFKFPNRELFEHYTTGLLYARENKLDDAIYEYKECLKIYPEFVPAYVGLAGEYIRKSDYGIRYSLDSLEKCKFYIDKGLEIDKSNLKLLNILVWFYYFTYDLKKCERICRKIEMINPKFSFVHMSHSWVALSLGDVDGFFRELKLYEHLMPTDWVTFLNEVVVGVMTGRREKVKEGMWKMKDVYALPFIINTAEGWYQMFNGDFDRAEEIFRNGFENNSDPLLRLALAECEFAKGDYKNAVKDLRWWIEKNPYSLKSYWLLSLAYEVMGKGVESKKVAQLGYLRASEMYERFKNPALLMYKKYFAILSGSEKISPDEIKGINLNYYGTFENFLKIMALRRLGVNVDLNFIPYDPKYWVSKFYELEVKITGKKLVKVLK